MFWSIRFLATADIKFYLRQKIKPGEFVGIAGHIGAGKSSLFSAIMGEVRVASYPGSQFPFLSNSNLAFPGLFLDLLSFSLHSVMWQLICRQCENIIATGIWEALLLVLWESQMSGKNRLTAILIWKGELCHKIWTRPARTECCRSPPLPKLIIILQFFFFWAIIILIYFHLHLLCQLCPHLTSIFWCAG